MMDDLVTWFRAYLDEEERVALAVDIEGWREATEPGHMNEWNPTEIAHVRRHDPARVLAEVEAKRRILDEVVPTMDGMEYQIDQEWGCSAYPSGDPESLLLVKLLALPLADQPGFREEWRV